MQQMSFKQEVQYVCFEESTHHQSTWL